MIGVVEVELKKTKRKVPCVVLDPETKKITSGYEVLYTDTGKIGKFFVAVKRFYPAGSKILDKFTIKFYIEEGATR